MALFALIPRVNSGPRLDERVRATYPDSSLRLDVGVWIVSTSDTTGQVAERLGIIVKDHPPQAEPTQTPVSAIVFGLSGTYTGRAIPTVWEWLKNALEKPAT